AGGAGGGGGAARGARRHGPGRTARGGSPRSWGPGRRGRPPRTAGTPRRRGGPGPAAGGASSGVGGCASWGLVLPDVLDEVQPPLYRPPGTAQALSDLLVGVAFHFQQGNGAQVLLPQQPQQALTLLGHHRRHL